MTADMTREEATVLVAALEARMDCGPYLAETFVENELDEWLVPLLDRARREGAATRSPVGEKPETDDELHGSIIKGHCPMGCGETLCVGEGGFITCSYAECLRPDAVSTLLEDAETEHVVQFKSDSFDVQHPLRERLNGDLFRCGLHLDITSLDGPPVAPGRYRALSRGVGRWHWELAS